MWNGEKPSPRRRLCLQIPRVHVPSRHGRRAQGRVPGSSPETDGPSFLLCIRPVDPSVTPGTSAASKSGLRAGDRATGSLYRRLLRPEPSQSVASALRGVFVREPALFWGPSFCLLLGPEEQRMHGHLRSPQGAQPSFSPRFWARLLRALGQAHSPAARPGTPKQPHGVSQCHVDAPS